VADELGLRPEDLQGVPLSAFNQPGPQGAAVTNVVWQRPTARQAHADFLREMRGTFGDLTRLPDPTTGDECRAWQGAASGGTMTIAICHVAKVVIEEALVGAPDRATEDVALSHTAVMAARVRQHISSPPRSAAVQIGPDPLKSGRASTGRCNGKA
jgi:hypothetical protein